MGSMGFIDLAASILIGAIYTTTLSIRYDPISNVP